MADFALNSPTDAFWSRRLGRLIDRICWVVLLVVIGAVIAGLVRRAHYEHSYGVAAIIALLGAFVLIVGLAQQAIAARDLETWRLMAEWQLRAARERAGLDVGLPASATPATEEDQERYYALLSDMLVREMMEIHDRGSPHGN